MAAMAAIQHCCLRQPQASAGVSSIPACLDLIKVLYQIVKRRYDTGIHKLYKYTILLLLVNL
jgi:hypothetical protein